MVCRMPTSSRPVGQRAPNVTLRIPRPEITYTMQSWPGDVVRMIADTGKVDGLGYRPEIGLEEGLRRLIAWHREEFSPPW